jgi:outer membrane protein assembly factor BamD
VHYQLGRAHSGRGEHLLAAQSFSRVPQEFPNDTLADDALFAAAREYQRMWRKPVLDAEYGQTALATYRSVLNGYPDSPLVPQVGARIAELNDWFAKKDLENAMHYVRRKAYDSAIIYLRDITRMYPAAPTARTAYLQLVRSYKAIRYREEMTEICGEMRRAYPTDVEVREACGAAPAAAAAPVTPPATPPAR